MGVKREGSEISGGALKGLRIMDIRIRVAAAHLCRAIEKGGKFEVGNRLFLASAHNRDGLRVYDLSEEGKDLVNGAADPLLELEWIEVGLRLSGKSRLDLSELVLVCRAPVFGNAAVHLAKDAPVGKRGAIDLQYLDEGVMIACPRPAK